MERSSHERRVWREAEARNRRLRKQLDRQVSGKKGGCWPFAGLILFFVIGSFVFGVSYFLTTA